MKVKIVTEAAAQLFSCQIGDYRDLQRPDAERLIESKDVAAVDETSAAAAPSRNRPAKAKK